MTAVGPATHSSKESAENTIACATVQLVAEKRCTTGGVAKNRDIVTGSKMKSDTRSDTGADRDRSLRDGNRIKCATGLPRDADSGSRRLFLFCRSTHYRDPTRSRLSIC